MGTATTVSPWYKLFRKGERGLQDFVKAFARRREVLSGLSKFIFSPTDIVMNQIVEVVASIEDQKNALSDNLKQLKILLEEERKAWAYMAQALLKHNQTITASKEHLEHADTLRLTKNQVTNMDAQKRGAEASIRQAFNEYRDLLGKILKAESKFLPDNSVFSNKARLAAYFERVRALKAIDAMEAA